VRFYGTTILMTTDTVATGLLLGAVMVAGTSLGKRVVDRVSEKTFANLIEAIMVLVGAYLVLAD
jgi:uncharacterized membrane protein YfcA